MDKLTLLDELEVGRSGTIHSPLEFNSSIIRLMELGLVPGTEVKVLRIGQAGGLMQIRVRGSSLCLAQSEARFFPVTRGELGSSNC